MGIERAVYRRNLVQKVDKPSMDLFLKACVAWVNLPYTILLAVTCLYWLSVILGVFDLDLFGSGGGDAGRTS